MFRRNVLLGTCIVTTLLIVSTANAALITMDIDAVCSISDYDPSDSGGELKIEYLISNTTQSCGFSDALYRILIPAGINQSIYSVHVPDHWVALVHSDNIELYTLNGYEAVQCGETKAFSIYARNTGKQEAEIEAMTTLGDWAIPVNASVPSGHIPEPATILLLACGAFVLGKRG